MIKVFNDLMEEIKKYDNKVLIYHDIDADGLCSAILLKKYLEKNVIDLKLVPHHGGPRKVSDKMKKIIKEYQPSYLMILDLAYDDDIENLIKLKRELELKKIAIIDHHELNRYIEENIYNLKDEVTIIKPQLFSNVPPERYPTSKLVYDLISYVDNDIKKYWWISAIGIIGDGAYEMWESFIKERSKKNGIEIAELVKAEELMDFAVSENKENISKVLNLLDTCENVYDITRELKKHEKVRDIVNKLIENHKKDAYIDHNNKLLIYEIEFFGLRSRIANEISKKYPEYVVIIYGRHQDDPSKYIISFRNQTADINVAKLIKTLSREVPTLEGGGHKPAAGASVDEKYLEIFLKKLKEKIKEIRESKKKKSN